jgi:hypothetical protein
MVVNFYLDEKHDKERRKIVELAQKPWSHDIENVLAGYVREALRMCPIAPKYRRLPYPDFLT